MRRAEVCTKRARSAEPDGHASLSCHETMRFPPRTAISDSHGFRCGWRVGCRCLSATVQGGFDTALAGLEALPGAGLAARALSVRTRHFPLPGTSAGFVADAHCQHRDCCNGCFHRICHCVCHCICHCIFRRISHCIFHIQEVSREPDEVKPKARRNLRDNRMRRRRCGGIDIQRYRVRARCAGRIIGADRAGCASGAARVASVAGEPASRQPQARA